MLFYFKILAVLLFFILQFAVVLPYYFSSKEWWEFTLGWFIVLVIDPIIIHRIWKEAGFAIQTLFEDKL